MISLLRGQRAPHVTDRTDAETGLRRISVRGIRTVVRNRGNMVSGVRHFPKCIRSDFERKI
jgi:hypothetical protein